MKLFPTCHEVQVLATEYKEGTLPFAQRLGITFHLLLCWACRAFLRGLEALPRLSRKALQPAPEVPKAALDALEAALKNIDNQSRS